MTPSVERIEEDIKRHAAGAAGWSASEQPALMSGAIRDRFRYSLASTYNISVDDISCRMTYADLARLIHAELTEREKAE